MRLNEDWHITIVITTFVFCLCYRMGREESTWAFCVMWHWHYPSYVSPLWKAIVISRRTKVRFSHHLIKLLLPPSNQVITDILHSLFPVNLDSVVSHDINLMLRAQLRDQGWLKGKANKALCIRPQNFVASKILVVHSMISISLEIIMKLWNIFSKII